MHNTTNAVLDRIAARRGLNTDYAIAKAFGCDPNRIYNYRKGRTSMDDRVAVQAAKLSGDDPARLIAQLHAERESDPDLKAVWIRVANMVSQPIAA